MVHVYGSINSVTRTARMVRLIQLSAATIERGTLARNTFAARKTKRCAEPGEFGSYGQSCSSVAHSSQNSVQCSVENGTIQLNLIYSVQFKAETAPEPRLRFSSTHFKTSKISRRVSHVFRWRKYRRKNKYVELGKNDTGLACYLSVQEPVSGGPGRS